MPHSASPSGERLLRQAQREFTDKGMLTADTAYRLMQHGHVVSELERRWAEAGYWRV